MRLGRPFLSLLFGLSRFSNPVHRVLNLNNGSDKVVTVVLSTFMMFNNALKQD